MIGRTVSHYRIVERLGGGGMGVVYRAEDLRLHRSVALKFLPEAVARDAHALERFRREARAASALNHPGICTMHDIDEQDGQPFIVMELLEGETLRRRVAAGPLQPEALVELGIQLAEALDAAHARGIIHRDVKPANVFVTARGQAKLLDFGLARQEPASPPTGPGAQDSRLATATAAEEPLTSPGTALGTVAYMSPEQALGQPLDARTDLFSLGVVLYEMATGRQPFPGPTSAAVFDGILHQAPVSPIRLNPLVSAELERIINKALEKDKDLRYQHAAELRADLKRVKRDSDTRRSSEPSPVAVAGRERETSRPVRRLRVAVVAVVATLTVVAASAWLLRSKGGAARGTLAPVPLTTYPGRELLGSFSPDGSQVVFAWNGEKQDNWDIYVKLIGSEPPLRLTTNPAHDRAPAWSPDGRQIAFVRYEGDASAVYLVSPLGGPERKLADFRAVPAYFYWLQPSISWSPDGDWLALAELRPGGANGITLVPVGRGDRREMITGLESAGLFYWPTLSPDGRSLAYALRQGDRSCDLYVARLGPTFTPVGPPRRLTHQGAIVEGIAWTPDGESLVYAAATDLGSGFHLWEVAVSGDSAPVRMELGGTSAIDPAVSRAAKRLAYSSLNLNGDIWELEPGARPREFLSSTLPDFDPQFSPDGRAIAFSTNRSGKGGEIWVANRDGTGPARLTEGVGRMTGSPRWSPDSRSIAYDGQGEDGHWDIYVVDAAGGSPRRLTPEPSDEAIASWSRDGRFVYYGSDHDGTQQVWRRPAAGGDAEQLTRDGGFAPFESSDGKTLYYVRYAGGSSPSLFARSLEGGPERQILESVHWWSYFPVEDGIYYVVQPAGAASNVFELRLLTFATGTSRVLNRFEAQAVQGLTVSPDRKKILISGFQTWNDDLMLVEGFR